LKPVIKAHLALLGTNIFFAINYTAVKTLINGGFVKPFGLNLIRVTITALLFWVMYLFAPEKKVIHKKDYGRFFLCALTGIAINQLLFIKGLSLTYSIHASLLMLTTPILITLIAAWLLKERLTLNKIIGLILGVSGALVLISFGKEKNNQANDIITGDILILLNAISYTIYFVLVKPLIKEYDPIMVLRIVFTLGVFMMLPFCWTEFANTAWSTYGYREIIILATIVLGGTFLAYLFNIYGIKILGASIAGAYIYSQPLFAAIIAISFLGEKIELYKLLAAVLIFAGVYIANKKKNEMSHNKV
jgi:drug/metabolite transporter (DMT)-like permease